MSISSSCFPNLLPFHTSLADRLCRVRLLFPPRKPNHSSKTSSLKAVPFWCRAQLLSSVAPATAVVYGTLLLGGGAFAYVRSGSSGSILGGLSGAALMAASYYLMQSPETKAIGDALGFGSAFLFSCVFGIRLAATRKLIPAGLLLSLSVVSLTLFLSAYLQDKF